MLFGVLSYGVYCDYVVCGWYFVELVGFDFD